MIFQALDDKKHCAAVYVDGEIYYDEKPDLPLTGTWSFSPHIDGGDIRYAQIYSGGKTLNEVCPSEFAPEWEQISSRMQAYIRSFTLAGVSLNENCFYDLVPERYLKEFCEIKNEICKHVFQEYEKPENYDFLVSAGKMISKIASRPLKLNFNNISGSFGNPYVRSLRKKFNTGSHPVRYNLFGTKTGRLSTTRNSFPIHNMSKDTRAVIEPINDYLVELDFNAAELRTLLALSGKQQPQQDIHDWHINNVFEGNETRDEAKRKVFAWMYNPERRDVCLDKMYDRRSVLEKYYDGTRVKTIFGREIEADSKHALNYIIQSTTSDLLLDRMIAIDSALSGMNSFASFCIHDNLVLDMRADECYIIPELVKLFSETKLGKYKVNMRVGRNFGDMRETNKWT